MTTELEYVVIGSGPSGAQAAQTLVEAGVKTTVIDVGIVNHKYETLFDNKNFTQLRKSDENQHRYMLGDNFESLYVGETKTGAQLTPPRHHLLCLTEKYLQINSENFIPMESLAYGGLGSGWGVGCNVFSDKEIEKTGLNRSLLKDAYKTISKRIGVSGSFDDAAPYTHANILEIQPAINIDDNSSNLLKKYSKNRKILNQKGYYMGQPALALLTCDFGTRKKLIYDEMEFYSDREQAAYRPWITIEQLKKRPNFEYKQNLFVTSFKEDANGVCIYSIRIDTNEKLTFRCKKLILASGTLGTARIVLRSFNALEKRLPLLCNPYTYIPCLQPGMLGKGTDENRSAFAQLSMFYDPEQNNSDVSMASIYSYRSLLLYKLINDTPLGIKDARKIVQYLVPAISIVGIHHPDEKSDQKYVELRKTDTSITGDVLYIGFTLTLTETKKIYERESNYAKTLKKLWCYPLNKINPGFGSSIHYAGTLPFSVQNDLFTLKPNGRINGTKNIYVADGSGFKYLPAKGITLTLMANAHCVALNLLNNA